MGLFPQSFIDDLRMQADIVQVIQDYVPLKRAGGSFKGLCPFHTEKTPSFVVNRDKGFFHCFGCGAGGDVFKFLELHEKIGFQDAVRQLAQRFGVPLPQSATAAESAGDSAEREALLNAHEAAAAYFRELLTGPGGVRARRILTARKLKPDTVEQLGIGYASQARDGLTSHLVHRGFSVPVLIRAGLAVEREPGLAVDRFRNRLVFPICRESGSVVAFGGRALEAEQQPKYLNSPETAVYSKGRILYGLHLTKAAMRRLGYAVLVEGYFDFAQVYQAGTLPVVASCGTAVTREQAHLLRRFSSKIVLNFDPDSAGHGAAARSSELLVAEGFQVNVALLPPGEDPDEFVRKKGPGAYQDALRTSRPYLEYLIDRTADAHDFGNDQSRRDFLTAMLEVAAQIPDAALRDQFADRLAHKARITEEVVRAQIRKAAVERRSVLTERDLPRFGEVKQAEKGLIWAFVHDTAAGLAALADLEPQDLETLASRAVLDVARSLQGIPEVEIPSALLARLNTLEAQLVAGIAAEEAAPAPAFECARALKRMRYRTRAGLRAA